MEYVIELEKHKEGPVYVAEWNGDPGRTYEISAARRYKTHKGAKIGLSHARRYRTFKDAKIVPIVIGAVVLTA
jgi:hypothetical protein